MRLADLDILDLSGQLAALPLRPGAQRLAPRAAEQYITFHYSAVAYADRSRAMELARIIDETQYHIGKNWGKAGAPPVYGDGIMYDFVVLSDGTIVRTRGVRRQLWHCGNAIGNGSSWSVHLMLGGKQNATGPQRLGVVRLFDALRAESNIPRSNVVAHCEWPRGNGAPQRSATYRTLPGQSECPGAALFPIVALYRAAEPAPAAPLPQRTIETYAIRGLPVYEAPNRSARIALGGSAFLAPGAQVEIDEVKPEWDGLAHLASGLGWVELRGLEKVK